MKPLHADLIKMFFAHSLDGKTLPFTVTSPQPRAVEMVVFAGEGWTIHFDLVRKFRRSDSKIAGDIRLYGDRQRFEEDIILAKLTLP